MTHDTHTTEEIDAEAEAKAELEHIRCSRRTFALVGGTLAISAVAGCLGSNDEAETDVAEADPEDDVEGDADAGDEEGAADGEDEDEEELTEEDVEQREVGTDIFEFESLEIIEFEDEIDEREYGDDQLIISGVVENHDNEPYDFVTVGVRAFDEDGHQMDRYIDITQDLQGGGTWAFEVMILEDADEVDSWDIGVSGSQY